MMPLILSAALKGTAVLVLAWIATALLRKSSADLRHRIWLAALVCLPLLMIPMRVPQAAKVNVIFTASALAATASRSQFPWAYVWAVAAALFLGRFAWNVLALARVSQRAQGTEIRVSDEVASPMTWGVFRPVILLPSYASDWTLAIQHERVHIARADWLWQSFAQTVTAVFWFHPLVWLASSRLRIEAEQAVDDAVLSSGADAYDYAAQLVAVARQMSAPSPQGAVAMVSRPALVERIAGILDATRPRQSHTWMRIAAMVAMLSVVPLLAAFQSPQPPYSVGDGVSAPKVIYRAQPQYTPEAKEARVEGEVFLSIVVDPGGYPSEVTVTKSLGYGLDEQAVAAVTQWRFEPGEKDGVAVPVKATISINFKLL